MKCPNHPDRDVLSFCHSCGEYLCRECLVDGKEYYFCTKEACQAKRFLDEKPTEQFIETNQKDNLVKFASFSSPIEAHLAKMSLEAEGVKCYIFDENVVQMNWLYSNAVGGVKVYINLNDFEKAKEIMKVEVEPKCPNCNSTDVIYEKFSRRPFFLGWLLLNLPIPYLKNEWKCFKCGHTWKDSETKNNDENRENE